MTSCSQTWECLPNKQKNLRKKLFAPHRSTPTSPISSTHPWPGAVLPLQWPGVVPVAPGVERAPRATSGRWWRPILEDHPRYRKWLVINPHLYKPWKYSPFWKGKESLLRRLTITMVIHHLRVLGWSSKQGAKGPKKNPSTSPPGLAQVEQPETFPQRKHDRLKPMKITNFYSLVFVFWSKSFKPPGFLS